MFEQIVDYYDDFMARTADPRVINFPTMGSPTFMIWSVIIYIGFIKIILTKYMQNRKKFELKKVMFYYNIFQMLISAGLCIESAVLWFRLFTFWKCNSVDYSDAPDARRVLMMAYLYYLSKYTEFLDTVFFILRKKFNQASFLHMYHHASMPILCWIGVKFWGGGSGLLVVLLNTFIHTVMYTYYLIAGLGPQYQKYVWWKKYMTTIQLIQFSLGIFHMLISIIFGGCNIPRLLLVANCSSGIFLFFLFSTFYKQEYTKSVSKNTNTNTTLTTDNKDEKSS